MPEHTSAGWQAPRKAEIHLKNWRVVVQVVWTEQACQTLYNISSSAGRRCQQMDTNHICGAGLHLVNRVLVTWCHVDIMVRLDFGRLYPGHRCPGGLYSSQFDLRMSYLDSWTAVFWSLDQMYLSWLYFDQLYLDRSYRGQLYLDSWTAVSWSNVLKLVISWWIVFWSVVSWSVVS